MSGQTNVLVIGGGAAGFVAAIAAARHGAHVRVVERMQRVGKKLLATGNGRCNLSNVRMESRFFHGAPAAFVQGVLGRFGVRETLAFFESIGIETREESEGRIFPLCGQASAVLDALRFEAERLGVKEICEVKVSEIIRRDAGLRAVCSDGQTLAADRIVVAAGGKSTPNMGSNGDGFKIAERMGHTVHMPFPALVPVDIDGWFLKRLKGLRIEGAVEVCVDDRPARLETGEILFADYGISGPPVLQVSRVVSEYLHGSRVGERRTVVLRLDLFPELSEADLAEWIGRRIVARPDVPLSVSFIGFIHKRLISVVLQEAGVIDAEARADSIGREAIGAIARVLKAWPMRCAGTQSWMFSQVTAGGVATDEMDGATLESRRMPGVFFAGEVLDVDGDSGGYNLQWAWSTGHLAGEAAAVR